MCGWRERGWTDGQVARRAELRGLPPPPPAGAGCRQRRGKGRIPGAYLGALAQQRLDERAADALRPAGDQSHLAIDVHGRRAPAARSAPAEPQKPSAVSPARFPFSLLRALPPALPPALLLPQPPLQRLIPPHSPLGRPRASRSCLGGGKQGRSGSLNRPPECLHELWRARARQKTSFIPSSQPQAFRGGQARSVPRRKGPRAATAPLGGEGDLCVRVCKSREKAAPSFDKVDKAVGSS